MRQRIKVNGKNVPRASRMIAKGDPLPTARQTESGYHDLRAIVEHSNDAIFSQAFDGTIQTWNLAAERIFGFAAPDIIGRSSKPLLPRGYHAEFRELIRRMRRGELVEHFETQRVRQDGRNIPVSLTLSPVRAASGELVGFSTIARDLTARRQMRDALTRREDELEDLFEEASVALAMVTRSGRILRANKAFGELVGFSPQQVVGLSLKTFHPDTPLLKALLRRLTQRQMLHNYPTELISRKGETRAVLVDVNVLWQEGRFIHSRWFIRDISQRKRLERELLEISERERRGFAQELHDGLGQQLGGIAYLSNVLREKLLERGRPEAAEAARVSDLMRNAIEQVRRVARGLSPIPADAEGLMDALRELAQQTSELFGLRCVFHCRQPVPVADVELAAHLFRIAQEAVNNAVKHARPRKVTIHLDRKREGITLTVADDGRGISPVSPNRKGLGLRIMRYRSGLIRGTLTIRKRPTTGTEVMCFAPCAGPKHIRPPTNSPVLKKP